jgi:hypothetical protein
MTPDDSILERWMAKTIASYPRASQPFLAGQNDPFRNPVGHTLRQSLRVLLGQVQGEMDECRIAPALDNIIRIRAVQDLTASQAVGFVLLLKPILRETEHPRDPGPLEDRIDRVALMAFDQYTRCREQLAEIRWNERQRIFRGRMAGEARTL